MLNKHYKAFELKRKRPYFFPVFQNKKKFCNPTKKSWLDVSVLNLEWQQVMV